MKPREIILVWLTCVIALFCVTAIFCQPWYRAWREVKSRKSAALEKIATEAEIYLGKENTSKRLQELQKKVRDLPAGETPNIYIPRLINNLAAQNSVPIKDTRIGDEWSLGKLRILPIRYAWGESSTQGIKDLLVSFHESDVIFDVVELTISSAGQDRLSGTLTVNCVYTK
ncbi:MAG: hypothetical protein WCL44_01675 [bacterium]